VLEFTLDHDKEKKMNKFVELTDQNLMEVEGGIIITITGAMVATGVGIFCGTFGVGYAIGKSGKR
jgi:lactobin A/cerein 7B family class IIb bacteriocin